MEFHDFILAQNSNSSPDFIAGVVTINGTDYTVKVPASSLSGPVKLIGKFIGADANSIADQIINLSGGTKLIPSDILICNVSIPLDTAEDLQFWTGPGRTGNQLFSSTLISGRNHIDSLSNLTDNTLALSILDSSVNVAISTSLLMNVRPTLGDKIYASFGIAQGALATCDIYVYGYILP